MLAKKRVPPVGTIVTCLLIIVLARYSLWSVLAASVTALDPCTGLIIILLCCPGRREARRAQPLKDLSVLDVGCGGGLLSEALARLGADVTGIDTSATAIRVAGAHAQADPAVASRTSYKNVTAEQLQQEGRPAHQHQVTSLPQYEHCT